MEHAIAGTLVLFAGIYAAIGVAFAIAFVLSGLSRVDSAGHGAGPALRLILIPGSAALWPLLLSRWLRATGEPPDESNAHRRLAADRPVGGPR